MRKKLPTMPEFRTFSGMEKAPKTRAAIYDYYAGDSKAVPYSTAGILFNDGSVAVQTYAADPYRLAHKFGGEWYEVCPIRADDPEMMKLEKAGKIYRPGPSPSQKAKEEKLEAERRELQERYQRYEAEQKKAAEEKREAREREAERCRDAARQRMA